MLIKGVTLEALKITKKSSFENCMLIKPYQIETLININLLKSLSHKEFVLNNINSRISFYCVIKFDFDPVLKISSIRTVTFNL